MPRAMRLALYWVVDQALVSEAVLDCHDAKVTKEISLGD